MSANYRIIHFIPDPFSGARVPVAAVVDSGQGRGVSLARAAHLPGPGCVGGQAAYSVMKMVADQLGALASQDLTVNNVSAMASFGPPQPIPGGVADPVRWVEMFVLPCRGEDKADRNERTAKEPKRTTIGYKFFERWHVGNYVRKRFRPNQLPGVAAETASPIAHYVRGRDALLLMEPLVPRRPSFEADLVDISQEFLAWRQLISDARLDQKASFVAYLFQGPRSAHEEARRVLAQSKAEVIEVDVPYQRQEFLSEIRRIGETGAVQGSFQ